MTKLRHLSSANQVYFVTTTTADRQPVFHDRRSAVILWNIINGQRQRGRFHLIAFVIMPDHLHLVIMPIGATTISFVMQEIKKSSSRLINRLYGARRGKLWLSEYHDHVVQTREELLEVVNYVHNNPVKKGLVESEEMHPFSSANPEYDACLWTEW